MLLVWNNLKVKGTTFPDFSVVSPLTWGQATAPHNIQVSASCAFIGVLSCAQRHRMLEGRTLRNYLWKGTNPQKIVEDFKKDVPSGVSLDKHGKMIGADPSAFCDYLFERVGLNTLETTDLVNVALQQVAVRPCVFPSLPVEKGGYFEVYTKEMFAQAFYDKYQQPKGKRVWHTQCAVGYATSTSGERFFVCLQSWKGSLLTFVPAMSFQDLLVTQKNLGKRVPTAEEAHMENNYEILISKALKKKHSPSLTQFTATKRSGMLVPPMHTGYIHVCTDGTIWGA